MGSGLGINRVGEVAGGLMAGGEQAKRGRFMAASVFRDRAAGVERAPPGRVQGRRNIAREHDAPPPGRGIEDGDCGKQGLGVGMPGPGTHVVRGTEFDDVTEIHHGDAAAEMFHDGEVVGDEEVSEAAFPLEILEEIDDLGLDADVEGADGLVADDESRFHGKGPGDADALALASAERKRMAAGMIGMEPDGFQEFGDARGTRGTVWGEPVDVEGFADGFTDGEVGIERAVGVLEDHLDLSSAAAQIALGQGGQFLPVQADGTFVGFDEAKDGATERGLTAAAFTHESDGLAGIDVETDVVEGLDDAGGATEEALADGEMDAEICDFEEAHGGGVCHGSGCGEGEPEKGQRTCRS